MLAPVSDCVPEPSWATAPLPLIGAPNVSSSMVSNASVPLSMMLEVPLIVLLVPPLPSCSVPAVIVVVPV